MQPFTQVNQRRSLQYVGWWHINTQRSLNLHTSRWQLTQLSRREHSFVLVCACVIRTRESKCRLSIEKANVPNGLVPLWLTDRLIVVLMRHNNKNYNNTISHNNAVHMENSYTSSFHQIQKQKKTYNKCKLAYNNNVTIGNKVSSGMNGIEMKLKFLNLFVKCLLMRREADVLECVSSFDGQQIWDVRVFESEFAFVWAPCGSTSAAAINCKDAKAKYSFYNLRLLIYFERSSNS